MLATPDPYQDSIEKATRLRKATYGEPVSLYRFGGYDVFFHSGYLVCGRDESFKMRSNYPEREVREIARWLDRIDKQVAIVHARRDNTTLFCDAVTYHPDLWEAQVESI